MKLQIFNNEKIELKTILELIPILYAVFSCLSILYFVGYYSKFDALWLIKDLSIPNILIYTTFQMIGSLYGILFALTSMVNQLEITLKSLMIKIIIVIVIVCILFILKLYFHQIPTQVVIFSTLILLNFLFTYTVVYINKKPETPFKIINAFQLCLGISVIYFVCGTADSALKVKSKEFYQVNDSAFYMLEKQNDHLIAFRKNPTTDKFEYKIIKNDDVISLSK